MSEKYTHWFPLSIFQDKIAAKPFQCSICDHIPSAQFATTHSDCGSTFCFSCILPSIISGDGCHECGGKIESCVSEETGKKLNALKLICPWHKDCSWSGKMEDMESHKTAVKKCKISIKKSPKPGKRKKLEELGNKGD